MGAVAATFVVGVVAGILSALLGIGGAVVTTPAVRVLGATPIEAVGSTVPAILPGAISGSVRYAREGLVDWRLAVGLGVSGTVFAFGGAWVSDLVGGRPLMVLTAALMLWSGVSVARGADVPDPDGTSPDVPDPDGTSPDVPDRDGTALDVSDRDGTALDVSDRDGTGQAGFEPAGFEPAGFESAGLGHTVAGFVGAGDADGQGRRPSMEAIAIVGAASGFVAGLLGVGGGIVMVPAMTGPLGIPMKRAVASSLVAVAIFSVPALITHVALGHVDWRFALPLMAGVVPGAQIGARMTIGAAEHRVRQWFGFLVVVVALLYGATELASLF